ncbi:MAG: hypothetical protein GY729_06140 [Desulfobacteraceae bacterium]|nr:hypothetical protein [Desulfobacteraceae bacterium]
MVSTNLALVLNKDVQLLDCDVEEPNVHLFLHPNFESREPVVGRRPFDKAFTEAMIRMETIFEYDKDSQAAGSVKKVWDAVFSLPAEKKPVTNILQHI